MTYLEIITAYPEHQEEIEERAAICEYHGNLSREQAETIAAECMHRLHLLFRQGHLFNGGKY